MKEAINFLFCSSMKTMYVLAKYEACEEGEAQVIILTEFMATLILKSGDKIIAAALLSPRLFVKNRNQINL